MFFDDCVQAMREVRRVLKRGGRACFVAWGPFEQPYWATTMGVVLKHVGGALLAPGGPDPFRFARPGSLTRVLREAGFAEVAEETRSVPWTWPGTAEEVWEQARAVSTPFLPMLKRVPTEKWDEINREVQRAVQEYVSSNSIKFGAVVVLASATKT
jgi:SAM-dependent methyltransferase